MAQYGHIITSFDRRNWQWYWQSILIDGGEGGPFCSEEDAIKDAQKWKGGA